MKKYDAVIVLGYNITPTAEGFAPTTYDSFDEYGMLAGMMNITAAVELWAEGTSNCFVFSTGTSAKTKAAYGPNVPTEAAVYSEVFAFQTSVRASEVSRLAHNPKPTIILEDRSVNTFSNLVESSAIIRAHGWQKVAVLCVRYHIMRVKALFELMQAKQPLEGVQVDFLEAESIVEAALPGVYDQKIAEAYRSEQGQKRLQIEAQGLRDMQEGHYVLGEFQLATPKTSAKR